MKQFICLAIATLLVFSGCAERTAAPAATLPEESSSLPSSSIASSSSSVPSSQSESEPPMEEEDFPLPILTDAELALLREEADLFAQQVGGTNLKTASEIDPLAALPAILAGINRARDLNGYFFEKNSSGQELIPEKLVQETATRMFGIGVFPQVEGYDLNAQAYPYTADSSNGAGYTIADPIGAPDGALAYAVTYEMGTAYLFTCKIVRINSIPFLQLQSIQRIEA